MAKRALVTGITGQDGAYLSKFLLEMGYEVVGVIRRSSHKEAETWRLDWLGLHDQIPLIEGNLVDLSSLIRILRDVRPDEIYNLAAQSFVGSSWKQPLVTSDVTGRGALTMLEAMRLEAPEARFYQASSSE